MVDILQKRKSILLHIVDINISARSSKCFLWRGRYG
ncbi:hypothetical protein KP509_01G041700 [Ceratopteris richardii]|uniref:Uncharacterized protein n=1 Tax=Ceratopteris richardii TaxID=49495 RepID=A0A8T2VCF6_CERRI|nr:hypothetical protein KP509_01G041700 [Ceratopteris richardii]